MTIKEMRQWALMSQREFGEFFGISKRTIESWESGQRKCPDYLLDLMQYKLENERVIPKFR